MKPTFHRAIDSNKTLIAPISLFGLMVLAYGLLLPRQGYSFDEWHFIYYSLINGSKGLTELFHYDGHPQSTWSYILSFQILGYKPIAWHLFAFFWKAANVLMFWALLNQVWPTKRQLTFTAALFFALYPFFTLQVFAIAYYEVWYSFFLLWLSIFLTIKAVQQPEKFWLWTGLALLAKVGHLFTSEYTWFLEIFRPLLIWVVLPANLQRAEKFRRTALLWMPYFILFFAAVIWRGFFYQPLRRSFRVPGTVFSQPHLTLLAALRHWIPDSGLTLFTSWFYTFRPEYLDLANRTNALILLVAIAGAGLTWFTLKKSNSQASSDESNSIWVISALVIGFIGLIAGFLPSYVAGYTAYLSEWPGNARLVLAALPGAALILTALLELIAKPRAKLVIIAALAGLLVSWHVRVNHEFSIVWEGQKDFLRQLTWRIPSLKPNTMLLLSNPYLPRLAPESPAQIAVNPDFSTSMALNAIYSGLPDENGRIPYWFSSDVSTLPSDNNGRRATPPPDLAQFEKSHATLHFSGKPEHFVALFFRPAEGACLHVLEPAYAELKKLPSPVKNAARFSRLDNILPNTKSDFHLLETIIGTEKTPTWCYYYQKGALAAQQQDWDEVIQLWKQAQDLRLFPVNGYEYTPFITASLSKARWQEAVELTRAARRNTPGMDTILCPVWHKFKPTHTSSPEQNRAFQRINDLLKCNPRRP